MHNQKTIQPVILCGGNGSRLWPLSRNTLPKQFIALTSEKSMLQDTAQWVSTDKGYRPPVIISNESFEHVIHDQLNEIGVNPHRIVLEPHSRNTAAAITLAALTLIDRDPDVCMLVLPSDHLLGDLKKFEETVSDGFRAASKGHLITFGMRAHSPATGYGYIRQGEKLPFGNACHRVERFVEKPQLAMAQRFLDDGSYHWNSGLFMFTPAAFLQEMDRFQPMLLRDCVAAMAAGSSDGIVSRPNADVFATIDDISLDHGLMEHTSNAVVVVADFSWNDIGSWSALADVSLKKDNDGNMIHGDVVLKDCTNVYANATKRMIAMVGVSDQVVVETDDAILIAPMSRTEDVKKIVEQLKDSGRKEATIHPVVRRPWGTYEAIHQGATHQVKHIVVNPGGKLSLQYHHHRAEHWTVVSGYGMVTVGEETKELGPNESIFIPAEAQHRLVNEGNSPLHLIEVQYGGYLGEDDIVRLDDVYGRVPERPIEAQIAAE